MAEWAARVRGLAAHCEFSASVFGELLRDRFVLGMVHGPERDKLFTMKMAELTINQALETAENMRSARLGSQQAAANTVDAAHAPLQVLKLAAGPARGGGGGGGGGQQRRRPAAAPAPAACAVCGYAGHQQDSCRFKHHACKRCRVKGHLKRMCPKRVTRQYYVECGTDDDDDADGKPSEPTPPPEPPHPPDPTVTKPLEPFKQDDHFLEKPAFIPSKPVPHSPKISPSSIPNPSPSVTTTKQLESGYPNYGGYLYSIPGYSAFQPVSYQGMPPGMQQNQHSAQAPTDFSFSSAPKETTEEKIEVKSDEPPKEAPLPSAIPTPKQQDFEEHFTPEIVPAASSSDKTQTTEAKMSITSLAQGSGATVTIPAHGSTKDSKKKTPERFSLKTSIPISKIDMKCVSNPPDAIFQNAMCKKTPAPFNPAFQNPKDNSRVEIQSNIVIKNAQKEPEVIVEPPSSNSNTTHSTNNSISTLLNAAETINKTENQFWNPDSKPDTPNEVKEPPVFTPQAPVPPPKPIFNPVNTEPNKSNFTNKPPDGSFSEQKNQILFIQNKNPSNPKMLLTIQQQNPQVLLQRTNFESKNLQAPSRLSGQMKKCKEEHINENGTSSKVVALKRLHQENCDENDFENLITENQIYGNKIVVKEKSVTLQEQDMKKNKDKPSQETKNVVLQPNFLYLSNVQFPANLMMIKNNKMSQTADTKANKVTANENKPNDAVATANNESANIIKTVKAPNVNVSKEIHVLKSSNNVLQTLANNTNKTDIVFQTSSQKVIMNPQIVYQVPVIVDTDNKINQPFINREYPKFISQNSKDFPKPIDQNKSNEKLYIACPYQMDSKLQPKIVITNIRPKITKIEEVSSLDIYEKRKRMRRLKYLSNREFKETTKPDFKKIPDKIDNLKNIITPDKMKAAIYKEFASTKVRIDEESNDSDSDYGEEELKEYSAIIEEFSKLDEVETGKAEFLAGFRLATRDAFKEKELDRQERSLSKDAVASAYITVGRLDRLTREEAAPDEPPGEPPPAAAPAEQPDDGQSPQRKLSFLTQLRLTHVPPKYKEGYEKAWQEILKERKRRNSAAEDDKVKKPKQETETELDPNGQLKLLTEIKKCVNDNNNLIKKRLDSFCNDSDGDSIHALAEKNFSELDRLSKMADRSVKLFSGLDSGQRDLNPGFDSENIQKPVVKIEQPYQNYPKINIPNISKIISLKSAEAPAPAASSPATSMDEPASAAAGASPVAPATCQEAACQAEQPSWPGVEALVKAYKEFEAGRKKEISALHRRNTQLRVECAQASRAAARLADAARALLAERRRLAGQEAAARAALRRLTAAVDAVRNYC